MTFTVELASKVTAAHVGRDAYVYVRQSTLTQMREHTLRAWNANTSWRRGRKR
jgi:hypothetical protein